MTPEHAFGSLWDELKDSVDKSGCLDDAKWIVPQLKAAKMMLPDQENPYQPIYIFALTAHLTDNFQNLWHTLLTSTTPLPHPGW